jgi:hypothetical protein
MKKKGNPRLERSYPNLWVCRGREYPLGLL